MLSSCCSFLHILEILSMNINSSGVLCVHMLRFVSKREYFIMIAIVYGPNAYICP